MTASVNKVILIGNVGSDPEVRNTQAGQHVVTLNIATTENWKDAQGAKQERTEWTRVVFWGRLAEVAGKYLSKGSRVYVEGSLTTRKWTDKQGTDRYSTEVKGKELVMFNSARAKPQNNDFKTEPARDFDDSVDDIPW